MNSCAQLASSLQEWWYAKSESFSELVGEDCTHREVVISHLVFTAGVVAVAIVGTIFG